MPSHVLQLIQQKAKIKEIQNYIVNHSKPPLFQPLKELKGKSLYDHLTRYGKLYSWSLEEFIFNKIIDFRETDDNGKNLMQHMVDNDDLKRFQYLLFAGEKPTIETLLASQGNSIGLFLNYRPGKNKPSVYELSTKRKPDINQLHDLMFDFYDTSDEESSDAEFSDLEELNPQDAQTFQENQHQVISEYNEYRKGADNIRFVAARGIHFVEKYFPKPAREAIRETRKIPHTTYSASTLFDAGYEADNEPEENDEQILRIHQRNLQFVDTLKRTRDRKEKKTEHRNPPKNRNNRVFANLFWREMQVYINSYDTLFNLKGIQTNFGFLSNNNPHLSLSWKTAVAGMYGGGVRFGWKTGQRRDPHYRRYDGKPKHPNVGFIDVFELPMEYVRANGVDRLLAYNNGVIDLSNIHLAEAEIIFHSMIPKTFHVRRHMVVLPSFERQNFKKDIDDKFFGMEGKGSYTRSRNGLFDSIKGKAKDDTYQKWVTRRTEQSVCAQSKLIDKATDVRLFNGNKVRAFDHGHSIQNSLPNPTR